MIVHNFDDYSAYENAFSYGKNRKRIVMFDSITDCEEVMRWWWIEYGSILNIERPYCENWKVAWHDAKEATLFMLKWS